jgi:TetR/AcrR family transcriptional regulator, mexJK operon transcriptional repressor
MKTWTDDHPKAKLMASKRAAILAAAQKTFLTEGFARASMEGIAASARVSIMTLYRHTRNKDDLFQAVISRACNPDDASEMARQATLMKMPLHEALVQIGMMFQDQILMSQTVALLRVVMLETSNFPELAHMAYRGFVVSQEERLAAFLGERSETRGVKASRRLNLSKAFINGLIGNDLLRVLLGMSAPTQQERRTRSSEVTQSIISALQEDAKFRD